MATHKVEDDEVSVPQVRDLVGTSADGGVSPRGRTVRIGDFDDDNLTGELDVYAVQP